MSDTELLLKPEAVNGSGSVQRVEVFTGTGRRRRWTAEQKAAIVAETYERGETVSAVARRHGLTTQQLFTWRRDARRAQASASRMAFAPVVLEQLRPHGPAFKRRQCVYAFAVAFGNESAAPRDHESSGERVRRLKCGLNGLPELRFVDFFRELLHRQYVPHGPWLG